VGVTITPNDGGDGGVFAPASVTLTEGAPIQTFTYMPASFGAKTLGVINSGVLTDPTNIICTVAPVEYALAGPSSGDVGVASTNFHVSIALESSIPGTVTVTPDDGGAGGTFTPTTVDISDSSRDAYFTYTAAGAGDIIISVTNDGGLIDPDSLTYAAVVAGLVDGDPVGTWPDSSVNGNDATQTGSARPTFKTNIVNSLPVVRFTAVGLSGLNLTTPISGTPWTVFAVLKAATAASIVHSVASGPSPGMLGTLINSDTKVYCADKVALKFTTTSPTTAFHVITTTMDGAGSGAIASDGTVFGLTNVGAPTAGNFDVIGWRNSPIYSDGDVAEIIVYAGVTVIVGDIHNIEKYLGDKYGITVASGSAVQPDTVTGLVAWWKADSLL
jgi:hypothetical protein